VTVAIAVLITAVVFGMLELLAVAVVEEDVVGVLEVEDVDVVVVVVVVSVVLVVVGDGAGQGTVSLLKATPEHVSASLVQVMVELQKWQFWSKLQAVQAVALLHCTKVSVATRKKNFFFFFSESPVSVFLTCCHEN
jgi:hypothetical protein